MKSRPAWGVWIEINLRRGMNQSIKSRPAWGVWIEIINCKSHGSIIVGRAPLGACGLKYYYYLFVLLRVRRAPLGACGLKYC